MLKMSGISRKYLRLAAVYRRYAGPNTGFSFTKEMLKECYNHETHGGSASKHNGFVFGKWCKDLSVVQWVEDVRKGNACKAEFYTPKDQWWAEPALKNVVVGPAFFPFSDERDLSLSKNQFSDIVRAHFSH